MRVLLASALVGLLGQAVVAVPVLSNAGGWNGSSAIGFFGPPIVQTVGQVFTPTGPETQLDSFTFFVQSGSQMTFNAYVQQFDTGTSSAVGNLLFSSGAISNTGAGAFDAVTVNLGGLALNAGTTYLAFFSTSSQSQAQTSASFGFIPGASTPGLGPAYQNSNGTTFDVNVGAPNPWTPSGGGELVFTANFSAAPAGGAPELDPRGGGLAFCFVLLGFSSIAARSPRGCRGFAADGPDPSDSQAL